MTGATDGDVDRALAAIGATPLKYHSFGVMSVRPPGSEQMFPQGGYGSGAAGVPNGGPALPPTGEGTTARYRAHLVATVFPLLGLALPEAFQIDVEPTWPVGPPVSEQGLLLDRPMMAQPGYVEAPAATFPFPPQLGGFRDGQNFAAPAYWPQPYAHAPYNGPQHGGSPSPYGQQGGDRDGFGRTASYDHGAGNPQAGHHPLYPAPADPPPAAAYAQPEAPSSPVFRMPPWLEPTPPAEPLHDAPAPSPHTPVPPFRSLSEWLEPSGGPEPPELHPDHGAGSLSQTDPDVLHTQPPLSPNEAPYSPFTPDAANVPLPCEAEPPQHGAESNPPHTATSEAHEPYFAPEATGYEHPWSEPSPIEPHAPIVHPHMSDSPVDGATATWPDAAPPSESAFLPWSDAETAGQRRPVEPAQTTDWTTTALEDHRTTRDDHWADPEPVPEIGPAATRLTLTDSEPTASPAHDGSDWLHQRVEEPWDRVPVSAQHEFSHDRQAVPEPAAAPERLTDHDAPAPHQSLPIETAPPIQRHVYEPIRFDQIDPEPTWHEPPLPPAAYAAATHHQVAHDAPNDATMSHLADPAALPDLTHPEVLPPVSSPPPSRRPLAEMFRTLGGGSPGAGPS